MVQWTTQLKIFHVVSQEYVVILNTQDDFDLFGSYQSIWNLKAQEIGILKDCTFCGKLFKTTILQNHKKNYTKCQFSTKMSDPLHLTFV